MSKTIDNCCYCKRPVKDTDDYVAIRKEGEAEEIAHMGCERKGPAKFQRGGLKADRRVGRLPGLASVTQSVQTCESTAIQL